MSALRVAFFCLSLVIAGGVLVDWQQLLLVASFLIVTLLSLHLAGFAWQRERSPGSLSFALLMLAVAVWIVTTAGSIITSELQIDIFFAKLTNGVIAWLGLLWFTFTFEFTHPESRMIEQKGGWLWAIPILSCLVIFTNELHGWMWTGILPNPSAPGSFIWVRGPWFWVHVAYNYVFFLIGTLILLNSLIRGKVLHRRQFGVLVIGLMFPLLANISYLAGWLPASMVDLSPFGLAITGMIYSWGLYQLKLFDSTPFTREVILEHIGEGFLALDGHNRIADINLLACRLLHLERGTVIGMPAKNILASWPALLHLLDSKQAAQMELRITNEPPLTLEVSLAPWYNRSGQLAGRLLILDDITRRKQIEEQLRQSDHMYRLVVNASPVGMVMTNSKGIITFSSPEVHVLFGGCLDFTSQEIHLLDLIQPENRRDAARRFSTILQAKEKCTPCEYRVVRQDGTYFWAEITPTPLLDEKTGEQGMLSIIRDVSWRKDLETRLQSNLEQQTFIRDMLQLLYRPVDLNEVLLQVVERIGRYFHFGRAYLCQDSPDGLEAWIVSEWCSQNVFPRAREAPLFRYAALPSWRKRIETEGLIFAPGENLEQEFQHVAASLKRMIQGRALPGIPADIADFVASWNIDLLVVLPVYGKDERVIGFLGFENCEIPDCIGSEQVEMLLNVGKLVSGALARKQTADAEQRQRALAEALRDTASALNSTLNYEEVLDRILANLERLVRHDSASIALVDEDNMVRFVRWRGYDAAGTKLMQHSRIPLLERETYRKMARTGEPIIVADTRDEHGWVAYDEYNWIRSYAGAPIHIQGKIAGFINLDSILPNYFAPDLASHLQVLADQAAVAIRNSQLYDAVHRRAEEMSTLYNIGMTLTSGLELEQVLERLFDQCRAVLPVDVFYVAMFEEETGFIDHSLYFKDGVFSKVEPRSIFANPGLSGAVIQERRTIYLPDSLSADAVDKYQMIRMSGTISRTYLGVPLIQRDRVIGVLSIQSYKPNAYGIEQIRLLETIANQASIAVQNANLFEQMRQMAITDAVTLLHTRRHFTVLGCGEIERALRYKHPLSALMIDMDHFKKVNDSYGHAAGDMVLQVVAQICLEEMRSSDIVGRWGGEEFSIILPETNSEGALQTAERIRRMVEEREIAINNNTTIHVTVSLGVSRLHSGCTRMEDLIEQADMALYQAKQAGRNRVVLY
jgi:diguanylate cyclase (GGDEF)-like protein/PAS domain S-box-containing protein